MCSGKCSRLVAYTLYPLILLSICCNIVLFFPDLDVKYAKEGHITEEVKYLGGVVGGGLMVLMPALYIQLTGQTGCCGNRLGMLVSIIFAGVGAVGAAYCFIVALIGLHNGPLCNDGDKWTRPFADRDPNYMTKSSWWTECLEPKNVVQFNMGLFITLMAASCLQVVLCVIQVINGLVGCLCGTGNEK